MIFARLSAWDFFRDDANPSPDEGGVYITSFDIIPQLRNPESFALVTASRSERGCEFLHKE